MLHLKKTNRDLFPTSSPNVLDNYRPNRIRLLITHQNRIILYINGDMKYNVQLLFTPMFKFLSLTTSNASTVEYFFNCKKHLKRSSSLLPFDLSYMNGALMFALVISFSINIITLFIIFIAWSTS